MDFAIVYFMAGVMIGIDLGMLSCLYVLSRREKKQCRAKKKHKDEKSLLQRIKNPEYQISSHDDSTITDRQKKEESAYRILRRKKENGNA